ncbi:MAG: tol-pal system protein YbgF [Deltaproteobacteria bacterium]|nr:tol-pal system protein YbgF [Deltaproteobacteria bacterium]MCB9478367.1 tol-pal system protein YbgF [Deltaproteobacteria bacterium]MCB9489351.1 tol-pal system protein YbgF [Deltaproteobacteria bacterium]
MRHMALIGLVILICAQAGCIATTSQTQSMDARIDSLERRIAEAQAASVRTEKTINENADRVAANLIEFDQMRMDMGEIKGKLDESNFMKQNNREQYTKLKEYLDAQFGKIDERLATLERKAGVTVGPGLGSLPADPDKIVAKKSEEVMYQDNVLELKKNRYSAAMKGFKEQLSAYPDGKRAPDAYFYMGEANFRMKQYADAILSFDEMINKFPKHERVPAAILNQAISFEQMGQKFDAKLFYEKVINQYPRSNEAKIARKKLEGLKK